MVDDQSERSASFYRCTTVQPWSDDTDNDKHLEGRTKRCRGGGGGAVRYSVLDTRRAEMSHVIFGADCSGTVAHRNPHRTSSRPLTVSLDTPAYLMRNCPTERTPTA